MKPARKTVRVILDSNALLAPFQLRLDIFQELKALIDRNFELVLLSPVQRELERLADEGSSQTRRNASNALKLAEKCRKINVKDAGLVDDIILQTARQWSSPVFTNDRDLRKKLRNINVPVIYVRQKSRLELDGRL